MSDFGFSPWGSGGGTLDGMGLQMQPPPPAPGSPIGTPAPIVNGQPVSARDVMNQLMVLLSQKVQGGDIKQTDDAIAALSKAASDPAANPLTLQANNMLTQAKQANSLADFMKANPQAAPVLQHAQDVPGLNLPGVPDYVQPNANPVASLGAGLAGLFAPRAAGAFGAAALQGAITATANLNNAKRQQYQFELQQSLLQHEDDVRKADAQARIDAQNAAVTNAYSAEQHADNLKEAVERSNASQLSGEAGNLQAFIAGSGPANAAKAQIAALEEKRKQLSQEQIQAYKTLGDVSTSVGQMNIEDEKLQQSGQQFQQSQQAAQQRAAQEMQRYDEDRKSREQIAGQRAALDLQLGNQNNATAMYRITTEHNDRVTKMQQDAINSGQVLKDPKTYETIAAQQTMDAAQQRLKDAQQQLNAPSLNNPNFHTGNDVDVNRADTHKRQLEVDYAQKQFDIARQQFLDAGATARVNQANQSNSYTDPDTGRLKRKVQGLPVLSGPGFQLVPR